MILSLQALLLRCFGNYILCDAGAQNLSLVVFGFFYSFIFYTAYASKYVLQNKNFLFITEVISFDYCNKKMKKINKKCKIFRVIIILSNHYFIILRLLWAIKGFILYKIKLTALKSQVTTLQRMANSRTPALLKNC